MASEEIIYPQFSGTSMGTGIGEEEIDLAATHRELAEIEGAIKSATK